MAETLHRAQKLWGERDSSWPSWEHCRSQPTAAKVSVVKTDVDFLPPTLPSPKNLTFQKAFWKSILAQLPPKFQPFILQIAEIRYLTTCFLNGNDDWLFIIRLPIVALHDFWSG